MKLCIFLQATYGDGEPTDSASAFCRWAVEAGSSGAKQLSGHSFAVFGLGNKQYEHFNAAARKLDASLAAAGCARVAPLGLGDDDGSLEDDWASWRTALWPLIEAQFPHLAGSAADAAARRQSEDTIAAKGGAAPPAYKATFLPAGTAAAGAPASAPPPPASGGVGRDAKHPVHAPIVGRRELQASVEGGRSTLHVELLLPPGLRYEAGDHVGLMPSNPPRLVAAAAARLGLSPDALFTLSVDPEHASELPAPFPTPISVRQALSLYADLQSPPRRSALQALAGTCGVGAEGRAQAARLAALAHGAGNEYAAWVVGPQRSLLEVLEHFPEAQPDLGVFFAAVAPRLAPRFYSISSSPNHPSCAGAAGLRLTATVAVVRGETTTGRLHEGIASTWLGTLPLASPPTPAARSSAAAAAAAADRVPLFIRTSTFRLPPFPGLPIVMVGPGTGLAPFRGFIQEREALAARQPGCLGEAALFFGCRRSGEDYLYQEELAAAVAAGRQGCRPLTALHVAFSREGKKKVYVQHLLEAQGAEVYRLLETEGGTMYVCGDAKAMAKDVHKSLVEVFKKHGGLTGAGAEKALQNMHDQGRLQRDVW